ncbi:hypothetical protein BV25DRAFT_1815103, partial [Artomyces pyxidatus]
LRQWIPYRDTFLDEMLRLEGMADAALDSGAGLPPCHTCASPGARLHCSDCAWPHVYCSECLISNHRDDPLHRVQRWNGDFFSDASLYSVGLTVQLGHDGLPCPRPRRMEQPLTIIDITGIHTVGYLLCDCGEVYASQATVQLLRMKWWPATVTRPRTAVTFRTLRLFHALTLQSKVNSYDFYNGIVRITDGAGLKQLKSRYKEFIRSVRCYRHLRMAKRGGRGHDPLGIIATKPGELVVECPACPNPGVNLPDGWQDVPKSEKWKYALSVAIDANFKLKLKKRSIKDVQLCDGWAYFVADRQYKAHLAVHTDEAEMKHCESTHNALTAANMPTHKRFAVNGVGACICNRHLFYRAHGVGDLQRGERYVNMDYIVLSSLGGKAPELKSFFFSYDISCQWSKNFYKRLKNFPSKLWLKSDDIDIKFVIPKFHLQAHGEPCQIAYSLNYTEGVGRTYGEGIEAGWADTNGAALSTREMGGSFRREALDDFFGAINWRKTVTMGPALLRSLKLSLPEIEKQTKQFNELNATFPVEVTARWEKMIRDWDDDSRCPNPYHEPTTADASADVRLELAQEEAEEAARGQLSLHEMSASVFLNVGLELEEQQYVLAKEPHQTPLKKATLQSKRNTLQHRIQTWQTVQQLYIPASLSVQASDDSVAPTSPTPVTATSNGSRAELLKLWLPSELPESLPPEGVRGFKTLPKEVRLRIAQADDALHHIRRQLRIRLAYAHEKQIHINGPGQGAMTRSHANMQRVNEKLQRFVARYRRARTALTILSPGGSWESYLLALDDDDVRSPTKDETGLRKGRRELSWIWRVQMQDARDVAGDVSPEEVHESMRVEWAQGRARLRRWREERDTLLEEMRRTTATLMQRSSIWASRIDTRPAASVDIQHGLNAYSRRQSAIYSGLAKAFYRLWDPKVAALGLSVEWPESVLDDTVDEPAVLSDPSGSTLVDDAEPLVCLLPDDDTPRDDESDDDDGNSQQSSDGDDVSDGYTTDH